MGLDEICVSVQDSECFFHKERKTKFETEKRPDLSEVSAACPVDAQLISFADLVANMDPKILELGAANEAALVLARGGGIFNIDYNDATQKAMVESWFICPQHRDELSVKWNSNIHIKISHKISYCSMYNNLHVSHSSFAETWGPLLSFNEAAAVLYINGTLVHVGIPLCKRHRSQVTSTINRYKNTQQQCPATSPGVQEGQTDRAAKIKAKEEITANVDDEPMDTSEDAAAKTTAFNSYLKAIGIQPHSTTRLWHSLGPASRNNYIRMYRKISEQTATMLVGINNKNKLHDATFSSSSLGKGSINPVQLEFLEEVKNFYEAADSITESRAYLSIVANIFPINVIQQVIPDLTSHEYNAARKMARRFLSMGEKMPVRVYKQTVTTEKLEKFIAFITSEMITTGIPFGDIKKKLSNGQVVSLPATVRDWTATKIVKTYKNYMAEKGEEVKI
uniref:Uncharacterized protein n=1 Tax=Panagrolaimus davidi TaxID=227884 RepID=A0A914PDV5_9BILA